ncbi:MAG TPA: hypothetical protein VMS54_05570, partial [Vicinamibacterales bacterium]|nr:hypothetical protein [Vicinamibacterales bacterium]
MNSLIPHPTDFAHASRTHGQAHVARVMIHAFRLIEATGHRDDASRLWGAVYLHDLARTHDGFCEVHGRDAVLRVNESTDLQDRLASHGVASDDPAMLLAVMMHCLPDDHAALAKPMWPVLSMLKDATGLDRVRTGDLERSYLRSEAAKGMVEFAQALYSQTRRIKEGPNHFTEVLKVAEKILGKPVPIPSLVLGPLVTKGGKGAKGLKGAKGAKGAAPVAPAPAVKGAKGAPVPPVKGKAAPPPAPAGKGKAAAPVAPVRAAAGRTPAKTAAAAVDKSKARRR